MWNVEFLGHDLYYLFYMLLIYSVIGWVYESCLISVQEKKLVNRGFLNGPIIPIYGFGAVIVYLVLWDYRSNLLIVFFAGCLLATVLEYITSLLMEVAFHTRWWDYSNFPLNVKGRISVFVSLFWGLLSVIMVCFLHPAIHYLLGIIPRQIGEIIGYVIIPLVFTDIIVTIISTIELRKVLSRLKRLREDITEYISTSRVYETGEDILGKLSNLRMVRIISELKESMPEIPTGLKEFIGRYQSIKIQKTHIRFLEAFPNMRVRKLETALRDLRETLGRKGVRALSKDIREEVKGTLKGNLSGFLKATLVGLLVLAQFAMIISLTYALRGYTIYLYSGIQVLSIIIVIGLVNDNRNNSYKISWICIIAALPVTGHIMFVLWGNRRRRKIDLHILQKLQRGAQFLEFNKEVSERFENKYPTKSRLAKFLESNSFPLFKNNKIEYYPMGEDVFEAIFLEMERAEKFILLNFFIVADGVLWRRMHEVLLKKMREGVEVKFLYDDFGATLRTPTHFKRSLEHEGMQVRAFNPIHKYTDKLYMNYRSHQKIIVIDGNVGFTGGMNLADEYVNLVDRYGVWKDNAVRVEGDAVWGLTVTFLQMWEVSSGGTPMDYNPYRPSKVFEENDVYCQVISDGPANNPRNPIEDTYKQMIYYAKKVLYITTPYLIIEDDMRDALITAARSGIDVRIITPFIPDKKNVKVLTTYNYGRLLEAGVRIFEYSPGFIHAKTILTEDSAIIGTINMDYRSFHLHYECGVWICDKNTVQTIRDDLLFTMDQSHEMSLAEWKQRPVWIKMYEKVLNLFSTLM